MDSLAPLMSGWIVFFSSSRVSSVTVDARKWQFSTGTSMAFLSGLSTILSPRTNFHTTYSYWKCRLKHRQSFACEIPLCHFWKHSKWSLISFFFCHSKLNSCLLLTKQPKSMLRSGFQLLKIYRNEKLMTNTTSLSNRAWLLPIPDPVSLLGNSIRWVIVHLSHGFSQSVFVCNTSCKTVGRFSFTIVNFPSMYE